MTSSQLQFLRFKAIDAHRGRAKNRVALLGAKRGRSRAMGVHQFTVRGPEFFDREIRAEQATLGAEDRDRINKDFSDMRGIVAMDEGAEARELRDHVRASRKLRHAGAPGCAS